MKPRTRLGVAAAAAVLALLLLTRVPTLYADYLWYASLDFDSVFVKVLLYRSVAFLFFGGVTTAAVYLGYRAAVNNVQKFEEFSPPRYGLPLSILFGVFVGLGFSTAWEPYLLYLNAESFGATDPYFEAPVSFYVFTLPMLDLTVGFLLFAVFVSFAVAFSIYAFKFGVQEYEATGEFGEIEQTRVEYDVGLLLQRLKRYAFDHMSVYLGLFLILLGANFYLARYGLVYSTRGAVFGVGSVEAAVTSPMLLALAVFAVLGGVAVLANLRFERPEVVAGALGILIVVGVVGVAAGAVYQGYVVEPDEFNKEEDYLSNEIEFTRSGFALDRVNEEEFDVSDNLSRQQVDDNPDTIDNLKLWDKRPLMRTYNEQNNLRTYYHFNDIKTDRYDFEDEGLRQVYISAREIEFEALDPGSQTWVNRHLVYTHGMGVVMSPVSEIGTEGFPDYYVDRIPPRSSVGLDIDEPRLYYGETTHSYNIVASDTRELDYPTREGNVYYSYTGDGGVPLSSSWRQIAYAMRFGDHQIFFSGSVRPDSRIQYNRDLETRVNEVAPFLEYDEDPYPIVADGELKWIYDAYTTTDQYPYSRHTEFKDDDINYLRNSVKVVVDAYTGDMTFYVAEEEPIVEAYRNVFPELFADMNEMPSSVREHVRYPQDAFQTQAEVNLVYHMQDEQVFYNREDEWRIPNEHVGGSTVPMEPYYIIMQLPGEEEPEFVQIMPFIPEARENMIGWMAARSDEPNYGEITSFLLSQQDLVFGPQQVEARIDQNPEISESITLWSRAGSSVNRGNLLAVPIDDTILYVEPLFLEAQGEGTLPQLQRVIVSHDDRVTMQPTLDMSLAALFGDPVVEQPAAAPIDEVSTERIHRLRDLYREAETALQQGDLGTYAEKVEEIGREIEDWEEEVEDVEDAEDVEPVDPVDPVAPPDEDEVAGDGEEATP